MKKSLFLVNLFIMVMMVLSACSPAAQPVTAEPSAVEATEVPVEEEPVEGPTPAPIAATDDLGFEILLADPAQKIISISPSLTEILYSVGGGRSFDRERFQLNVSRRSLGSSGPGLDVGRDTS